MNSTNYVVESDSFNAGGGTSTSTNYVLVDAFGEIVADTSTSTNYQGPPWIDNFLFRYLNISTPSFALFSQKNVSSFAQTSIGTISNVEVVDDGTVGWSVTFNTTHFTATSTVRKLAGDNNTVSFAGVYDGLDGVLNPNGTFVVEITTGGTVGNAVFSWTDPAGNTETGSTTASSVSLSNGISVNFGATTYVVDDEWSANVDVFPYTGLTVTPSSITEVSGDGGGVSAGAEEILTGSGTISDSKTLMTGAANNSTGTYQQDEAMELNIHPNSLEGNFSADATITII